MKIAALLSGGVDSASALSMYLDQNPHHKKYITAYYLKIWLEDELSFLGECPWEEDLSYATQVADQLDIPLDVIPLQREYYDRVVSYTLSELKAGRTPSPDIFCNEWIKFGAFLDKIDGADRVISGHYAKVEYNPVKLIRSVDPIKDQSYFLSHLNESQLSKIFLPLGEFIKTEVRNYARKKNLAPCKRKDSQGICFLGKIKYKDFVNYHLGTKLGKILEWETNKLLGTHDGTWFYTIGQRSGLGLGGGPWYVCKKSLEENIVWVRHADMLASNFVTDVPVASLHCIRSDYLEMLKKNARDGAIAELSNIEVKIRHGEVLIPASVEYNLDTQRGMVRLARGDAGVAEGQFTVLYEDLECIGCAKIQY